MTNVRISIVDGELIIKVKLNEDHGLSKSGANHIVASSHGFVAIPTVPDGSKSVRVNLSVISSK